MNDVESCLKYFEPILKSWGAYRVGVVPVEKIEFEPSFRSLCESNACGRYGKSWMCPPHIGKIEDLIAKASSYRLALVYQVVGQLEDSFDIEGMLEAGNRISNLTERIRSDLNFQPTDLQLGVGCRLCEVCAVEENKPCRFPDRATSSLEAYGVNVSKLAPKAGMKYINGPDTVTNFGAVFFNDSQPGEETA